MFEALGWDFYNRSEVTKEEDMSGGRVDYGIYLNDQPKLFIEAKKLGANLHDPKHAEQAIGYCFNRVVTWAVLTNFESIKVFNAQNVTENLSNKLYFEIPYSQYVERFDQLWLLSKESFESGLIDAEAMKWGKLTQKVTVTEQLAKDLNEARNMLTQSLHIWNETVSPTDLDEGVQKLLDRFIFLRVAEDRGIEEPILKQLIREFNSRKDNKLSIYQMMVAKFRELDEVYNSGLFSPHPFEKWQEYDGTTEKVIDTLYGKTGYYEYDFKLIPSDVLGQVYENYLGHLLNKSKKGLTLDTSAKKRKEQGIYYTPSYIEDYIVRQALKPILDRCSSIAELKEIKVLDPACGSGSFLIKAMEMIEKKYVEFGARKEENIRLQIILNNIYGVDLDEKAVEIARLNLVINSLESRMKLPGLEQHIKNGNSLISGSDEELKKYFGKNYRDKKPFNWEEEFPEVFKRENPGFDLIIGNPPYIRSEKFEKDDREYFINSGAYKKTFGRFDLYILFVELATIVARKNGYFAYIMPSSFFNQNYAKKIRTYLLEDFTIQSIDDYSGIRVFDTASVQTCVLVATKNKPTKDHEISIENHVSSGVGKSNKYLAFQLGITNTKGNMIRINEREDNSVILKKITSNTIPLSEICYVVIGAVPHDSKTGASKDRLISKSKSSNSQVPYVEGKDIGRYRLTWRGLYLDYQPEIMHRPKFPELFENAKIFVRNISTQEGLLATLDPNKYYSNDTLSVCVPWHRLESVNRRGVLGTSVQITNSKKYDMYSLTSLINSKLLNYYFKNVLSSNLHVYPEAIRNLPIILATKDNQNMLSRLCKDIIELKTKLEFAQEGANVWQNLKTEINKTDRQIDQLVYQLYGISEKEIAIIEGSSNER